MRKLAVISESVAWAYRCTLWAFVIALVGWAVVLFIISACKEYRRHYGHLRGSHPSQFQDGIKKPTRFR